MNQFPTPAHYAGGALLVLDGDLPAAGFIRGLLGEHSLLVAADGAGLRLHAMGIVPEVVIGDLDTIGEKRGLLQEKGAIVLTGKDYISSILLADGWSDLARMTGGALFVAVPGDNEVVVGLAKDDETIKRLNPVVIQDYQSAERPVSPYIYRWATTGWAIAR